MCALSSCGGHDSSQLSLQRVHSCTAVRCKVSVSHCSHGGVSSPAQRSSSTSTGSAPSALRACPHADSHDRSARRQERCHWPRSAININMLCHMMSSHSHCALTYPLASFVASISFNSFLGLLITCTCAPSWDPVVQLTLLTPMIPPSSNCASSELTL